MPRHALSTYRLSPAVAIIVWMVVTVVLSACSPSHKGEVDGLNSLSYAYHYRNLDSTKLLAQRALALSDNYDEGYAEACNNLAFVAIAKMDYQGAKKWLAKIEEHSNNQIELLVADVQSMRLCQRESHNKDFYAYRERAIHRLRRIGEEADNLPDRERRRVLYARSEFDIVAATYFYYIGLDDPMFQALDDMNGDELEQDTAQYLNFLYNYGSGGAITQGTTEEINQKEFDYLMQCYMLASGSAYPYWQGQALQALSEHLQTPSMRDFLIRNNLPAIHYLNVEQMPDSLLAGNFAQRALNCFEAYGDVYQTAGANRTLAECYWAIGDYTSAESCLNKALNKNKSINQAPDLVASIREQLCLVYSAMNDKPHSDYNRNLYLDLQEQTRQDRQLEARAALLDHNSLLLNSMIVAVVAVICIVLVLLFVFDRMKRKKERENSTEKLLEPLEQWKQDNLLHINELNDRKEEIDENRQLARLHTEESMKRNLEQRAKVSLVNTITPFIDRMVHEVDRLVAGDESETVKKERYEYISELTDQINAYNDILTQWIQMRQGSLNLHIESFPVQPLFDIVEKGKMSFSLGGVDLQVEPSDAVVKADRTLTLFMINTIADNARKFTPKGGQVKVSARSLADSVEIAVTDNGKGMDEETLSHVFDRTYTGGHGFGLLNCKGIIEKYKKVSSIFQVCDIRAESRVGEGSRFTFRLPKGLQRFVVAGLLLLTAAVPQNLSAAGQHTTENLRRAGAFADSAYFCNIRGAYPLTVDYADSARHYLNLHYLSLHPKGKDLMQRSPENGEAAELKWLGQGLDTDYSIILDLRNETAVAALALHDWALYRSNNKVYTQLFRERSVDRTLPSYVRTMQVSENSKTVAIVLLVLLLLQLPLAYYILYYRHVLRYRFAVEKVNAINRILLSEAGDAEKLQRVQKMWTEGDIKHISEQLDEVVGQIEEALRLGIEASHDEAQHIEMAEDELRRAEYENAKLHVANSVLDNCLSALKHETMYYPSRIRQLIDTSPSDVHTLREVVDYYKSLYTLLSAQAQQQVDNCRLDPFYLDYLFTLLRKEGGGKARPDMAVPESTSADGRYVTYLIDMPQLQCPDDRVPQLFTPHADGLPFMLCRQIVREMGEVTNLRGSGIGAVKTGQGIAVRLVLPKVMVDKYKNSKKETK